LKRTRPLSKMMPHHQRRSLQPIVNTWGWQRTRWFDKINWDFSLIMKSDSQCYPLTLLLQRFISPMLITTTTVVWQRLPLHPLRHLTLFFYVLWSQASTIKMIHLRWIVRTRWWHLTLFQMATPFTRMSKRRANVVLTQ
jgi:hypothetical protein